MRSITDTDTRAVVVTDSQPTIALMMSDDDRKFRNKYFGSRSRRLRDEVRDLDLEIQYIKTKDNVADVLTKPLPVKQFMQLTGKFII